LSTIKNYPRSSVRPGIQRRHGTMLPDAKRIADLLQVA
jgi:hypothetical protein